ncbi:MAG: XisI protein [Cyanobacteria bacterium P01_F01_bin.150]
MQDFLTLYWRADRPTFVELIALGCIKAQPVNARYMLFRTGWDGERRMHHCIFHFDIKAGKIWLQANNTDIEVDLELAKMGIAKDEIVVGFHHPSMREYSDFAIA